MHADQLAARGVDFTWRDARAKSVKILLEYRAKDGQWHGVDLGSGFLISPDGLFITAYHVMKFCLEKHRDAGALSVGVDCSTGSSAIRYKAVNADREFEIEIISHLNELDSTSGKDRHTPDEIIKQKDFVIGKLKHAPKVLFDYWRLRDFDENLIDPAQAHADFQLVPLMPPKRVFIIGFPKDRQLTISEGFLNLTEKNRRGYFAANYRVYSENYLERQGVATDTKWGMAVRNHMSGGPVVDAEGFVIGVVVNGDRDTAGVLSIENVLTTFFSRTAQSNGHPAISLSPTQTPLYLRTSSLK